MSKSHASPARLEAFSDGVIAVIITIMVLDLKVPLQNGIGGFMTVLPALGVYALSFTFTGIYWINHHHLIHRTDQADERVLYANLFFLFCLSLIPFMTNYLVEKKLDSFSVLLYVASKILTGASFMALRLTIAGHLRDTGRLEHADTEAERKHWISLGMYLLAIGLSFRHPQIALGIVALVMVLWIIPSAKVKPLEHCVAVHTAAHEVSGEGIGRTP